MTKSEIVNELIELSVGQVSNCDRIRHLCNETNDDFWWKQLKTYTDALQENLREIAKLQRGL